MVTSRDFIMHFSHELCELCVNDIHDDMTRLSLKGRLSGNSIRILSFHIIRYDSEQRGQATADLAFKPDPQPLMEDEGNSVRRRVVIREDDDDGLRLHPKDRVADAGCCTTEGETEDDSKKCRTVRRRTRKELERIHFQMVNDRVVEDITLDILTDRGTDSNVYDGCLGTLALFLVVSALAFPNGPFIRPHPVLWRIIFGMSVIYLMILQFTLFQTYADIKKVLSWLDPDGLSKESLEEKAYAVNCSDVSLERIWSHIDVFAVGHFLGWAMKALLIRHGILCWYISIAWELTEVVFTKLLPNFEECWWDAIILDVLLCNGLGIWFGLKVCSFFRMRQFHWESIKDIKSHRGRFKRAVMQFTPESWTELDWFNSTALRRTMAVYVSADLAGLLTELNTFFLKHVFAVDTKHAVVFWRIILIALISAPSIRLALQFELC
ncbi:phosphatidyl serine synthase [Cooperia oncophora]